MVKTKEFNPFEFMQSQAEINAFLLECYEDEDPNTFVSALGYLAKHHGMTEVAKAAGLSRESLYKAVNGKVQPKWDTVHRLMRVLGVRCSVFG